MTSGVAVTEHLSVPDVARELQVSQRTVRRWIRLGKLDALAAGQGRQRVYLVRREDVEQLPIGDLAAVRRTS